MTENADLQSRNQTKARELAETQQQLREKVSVVHSGTKRIYALPLTRRKSYTIKRNSYNPVRGRR